MKAQVLLTAAARGVFDRLASGPRHTAEIAATTGLPEASADRRLAALCALEIVTKLPDGRFANGPEAAERLVRGSPGYLGALFHQVNYALYPIWPYCSGAFAEQAPQWERACNREMPPHARMSADPLALRPCIEGLHAMPYQAVVEFAASAAEVQDIGSLVDVGGASGACVIALAERCAALRATVLDRPPVQPMAEDFLGQALSHRPAAVRGRAWPARPPTPRQQQDGWRRPPRPGRSA